MGLEARIWASRLGIGPRDWDEEEEEKENEEKILHTVEPRSNGPATNGILPITDTNSWSLQPNFFYFLC